MAVKLAINFRFRASAQRSKDGASILPYEKIGNSFARIIMDDVALSTAERTWQTAQASLRQNVNQAVRTEIAKMAYYMGRFVTQQESRRTPQGMVKAADQTMSETMRRTFKGGLYTDLNAAGVRWAPRQTRYVRRKKRKLGHARWWDYDGLLKGWVSSAENLIQAFGPVAVLFTKVKDQRLVSTRVDAAGKLQKTPISNVDINRTASGRSGRLTQKYAVGRVEVIALGNLTAAMLPGLANGDLHRNNVDGRASGLIGLVDRVSPDVAVELGQRRTVAYRPVLEPFLTFYLTRAIPNAVFNRIERTIGGSGA